MLKKYVIINTMTVDKIKKFIKQDPHIKGGMPVIAGTRVAVAEIIHFLEDEKTISRIINELKKEGVIVTKEEVFAALEFAKQKTLNETKTPKTRK